MTLTILADPATAHRPESAAPSRSRWRAAPAGAGLALAGGGLALAWAGGTWGLAGTVLAAAGAWVLAQARHPEVGRDSSTAAPWAPPGADASPPPGGTPSATPPGTTGPDTGHPMIQGVVPVWARQLEATRLTTDEGLSQLLQAFSEMSGPIDLMLGSLDGVMPAGTTSAAIEASSPALAKLRQASQRAFDERAAAVAELQHCNQALVRLAELARTAKEVSRHSRLIAFNASIEANRQAGADRADRADKGNQAVAGEMRSLADRMGATADEMQRLVDGLVARLAPAQLGAEVGDTAADELALEIDLRAREALTALLGQMGQALRGTHAVQEAGQSLRAQLDQAFVHFQFGDRVSQMLSIVANDMTQFVQWTAQNPQAGPNDARAWLERLEASYTMEEQRSEHHGNVHIDRGSEVEFF